MLFSLLSSSPPFSPRPLIRIPSKQGHLNDRVEKSATISSNSATLISFQIHVGGVVYVIELHALLLRMQVQ